MPTGAVLAETSNPCSEHWREGLYFSLICEACFFPCLPLICVVVRNVAYFDKIEPHSLAASHCVLYKVFRQKPTLRSRWCGGLPGRCWKSQHRHQWDKQTVANDGTVRRWKVMDRPHSNKRISYFVFLIFAIFVVETSTLEIFELRALVIPPGRRFDWAINFVQACKYIIWTPKPRYPTGKCEDYLLSHQTAALFEPDSMRYVPAGDSRHEYLQTFPSTASSLSYFIMTSYLAKLVSVESHSFTAGRDQVLRTG